MLIENREISKFNLTVSPVTDLILFYEFKVGRLEKKGTAATQYLRIISWYSEETGKL